MPVIHTNPRAIFHQNKVIIGNGLSTSLVVKRTSNQNENFSQHVNPIPFRVGMEDVQKKQMLPNPANMFVPPSALDLSTDLLNGVSFKPSKKSKPKNVKLNIK
jgi:hypothetical protein